MCILTWHPAWHASLRCESTTFNGEAQSRKPRLSHALLSINKEYLAAATRPKVPRCNLRCLLHVQRERCLRDFCEHGLVRKA